MCKSEVFYERLREETKRAKENTNVACLTFDFQQKLPLPVLPSTDVFYCTQLWMYNFNIHCCSSGKAHMFMYTECDGKKGPGEVVSCLDWYLKNVVSPNTTEIVLFSDNCAAQNKNKILVQYLFSLTHTTQFQKITHSFSERGHSFLLCDRDFGNIEKKKRLISRLHIPEEWYSLIRKTSKLFTVVPVTQSMFKSYKEHFKPFFKEFTPLNKTAQDKVTFPENSLYNGVLPLKKHKYDDVMKLVTKYIPSADMKFYEKLFPSAESTKDSSETSSHESE